jgi:hypothetical protein
MEGWLSIRAEANGRGHIRFKCIIRDEPGIGNTLDIESATDQTFTRSTRAQLAAVVKALPIIGRP